MTFETPEHSTETHELGFERGRYVRIYETSPNPKIIDDADDDLGADLMQAYSGSESPYGNAASDESFEASLVVREMVTNALYHGNLGVRKGEGEEVSLDQLGKEAFDRDPAAYAAKKIRRELTAYEHGFVVSVEDQGAGFTPKGVVVREEELLNTHGRGWQIAHGLGFHPSVEQTETGCKVSMRKDFREPKPSQ